MEQGWLLFPRVLGVERVLQSLNEDVFRIAYTSV